MTFQIGFCLHAAIFINQTYVEPYFKLRNILNGSVNKHLSSDSKTDTTPSVMSELLFCLEWVLHLAIGLLSVLMLFVISSSDGAHCSNIDGPLAVEATWLCVIAIAQLLKVVLFIYLGWKYGQIEEIETHAREWTVPDNHHLRSTLLTQDY